MQKLKARILVVDDDPDILTAARVVLMRRFEVVDTEQNPSRLETLIKRGNYDTVVLDMNFAAGKDTGNEGLFWLKRILALDSALRVILITAYGDIQLAVAAMKLGASDFIVKPWDNESLVQAVQTSVSKQDSKEQKRSSGSSGEPRFIGKSDKVMELLHLVRKVAPTEANVILLGENGTGKELIAQLLHQLSLRREKPFIKIDVGSLPASLFEAELFGHKKGAFTDAREEKTGRLVLGSRGTVFFDEIGNLPLQLQPKLLTALQSREVTPLGANEVVPLDIRVISATNEDIRARVKEGSFREDLLFRINTIEIRLPSLRERKEDVPLLAEYFFQLHNEKYGSKLSGISPSAMDALIAHTWPGNVRELGHAIERAVIMSDSLVLQKSDFVFNASAPSPLSLSGLSLDDVEKNAIMESVDRNKGNMTKVARELGLGRTTLYRKMIKYGLNQK